MRCLDFAREATVISGRRIRRARFDERSTLPIPAACLIANGMRETLSRLLGSPIELRLTAPLLPNDRGWEAIAAGAHIFRARGARLDAALLVRAPDALALAGAAFGEEGVEGRDLSIIETTVFVRIVRALGPHLAPLLGTDISLERSTNVTGLTTYFEVVLSRPVPARIGIALSNDPSPDVGPGMALENLLELKVDVAVRTAEVNLTAEAVASLEPGTFVPISHARMFEGSAHLAGRLLHRGECGVRGGRYAFAFGASAAVEGSNAPSL